MAECKICGAPVTSNVCGFCGGVQTPPVGREEELDTLNALVEAGQKLALSDANKGSDVPVATFWSTAWMPTHPDALAQAAMLALQGAMPGAEEYDAFMSRAQAALDGLRMAAPTDARSQVIQARIAEKREEARKHDAEMSSFYLKFGIGFVLFVVCTVVFLYLNGAFEK